MRRTNDLYQQYVVAHSLEREVLFRLLLELFTPETVLYPGCFLHITPSFWLRHVVYVDRNDLASQFFADADGVRGLVEARKHYRQSAYLRFIHQDFAQPLPLPAESFDLLLALYTPDVSRSCATYLKPGGLLLSNNHRSDAADALADPLLDLVAVISERRGAFTLCDGDLQGYLVPKPTGARRGRELSGQLQYERSADYYLFRRSRAARRNT